MKRSAIGPNNRHMGRDESLSLLNFLYDYSIKFVSVLDMIVTDIVAECGLSTSFP